MRTNALIATLATDTPLRGPSFHAFCALALGGGIVIAALVFSLTIGPRADLALAAATPRFWLKFVVTGLLATTALWAFSRLARPGADRRPALVAMLAVPALLGAFVAGELLLVPRELWGTTAFGENQRACLTFLPLISAGPLAAFLLALRRGAPTQPMLGGLVAGLVAGGIGASFYAAHCTDDSPLFVVIWYPIAIGVVAFTGALTGARLAKF